MLCGSLDGKEIWERMDTCMCMAESLCCPPERNWQPTPIALPGEFHGQRSLKGYSLWGGKELDMTEQLTHTHMAESLWCLRETRNYHNIVNRLYPKTR